MKRHQAKQNSAVGRAEADGRAGSQPSRQELYRAVCARDSSYDGLFYFAVRTTGVFCRPVCRARRPNSENVEFFQRAEEALLAGYRPCKKCDPLSGAASEPSGSVGESQVRQASDPLWIQPLLDALDAEPERRWSEAELRLAGFDPVRVRRWFQAQYGMTFHAHQRARRLGNALGQIQAGSELLDTAYAAGYESNSGFRRAFQNLFGVPPGKSRKVKGSGQTEAQQLLSVARFSTPLGFVLAAATEDALCLLEFAERRMLSSQIERLRKHMNAHFVPGSNGLLQRTERQLTEYFEGSRRSFDLPLALPGTEFQQAVWQELQTLKYGQVCSYAELSQRLGRPKAVRAVGRANGDNRLAIVVPCHRVVGADGRLVGYGGQLWRKQRLLELEGAR